MKSLEYQAEEYFPLLDTTIDRTGEIKEENLQILGHRRSFIAGANSPWVQAEKIKYALEQLYKFRESTFGKGKNVIDELEQKLKEL